MEMKAEFKLKQVLAANPAQTVIVVGAPDFEIDNYVSLSADIDERELHIPMHWHKLIEMKAKKPKAYLLIEGLDRLDDIAQQKFAGLLKDRRAGNYKLPANVQIVIPVAQREKVSAKIQSLSLVWEVK